MGEITAGVQHVTNTVEKVLVEQASHVEAAVSEVGKLQAQSVTQAGALVKKAQDAVRVGTEKLAFTGKVAGEWGKQVLAATKTAFETLKKS